MRFDPEELRAAILEARPAQLEIDESDRQGAGPDITTSLSLARALALGCVTGWTPRGDSPIEVWDPAIGEAGAASLLSDALMQQGLSVAVRGNDVSGEAVQRAQARLSSVDESEVVVGDSLLAPDLVERRPADLVIVDPPWGMHWGHASSVIEERRERGEFRLGLPPPTDSTWLFISLAIERLKDPADGGGRVAALVHKNLLSSSIRRDDIRRAVLESGQLESVVRLPEALAPTSDLPLYLMTLTNAPRPRRSQQVQVMDLRTGFTTAGKERAMTRDALEELAHNLAVWRSGQRNRIVDVTDFTRRSAELVRTAPSTGESVKWTTSTSANLPINAKYLVDRYGDESGIELRGEVTESVDLDPSQFFDAELRDLQRDLKTKAWAHVRLPAVLQRPARAITKKNEPERDGALIWVPTFKSSAVTTSPPEVVDRQRFIELHIDDSRLDPEFLAAWLNSDWGQAARQRALTAAQPRSSFAHGVSSSPTSLMRWTDELIVPIPGLDQQKTMARTDQQIRSYTLELERRRASIWAEPDSADGAADALAHAFDESLNPWLEQIPYPLAMSLWTALSARHPATVQRNLFQAWEAIVTYQATLLLSGLRTDAARSERIERSVGATLRRHNMSIERATLGTWSVIVEKLSSEIRATVAKEDADETAQLGRSFADLPLAAIERLASKELVALFNDVITKRNRWHGHSGYTSDEQLTSQNETLLADVHNLRAVIGNAWTVAPIVRAGALHKRQGQWHQDVEIVRGTRTPFQSTTMIVGEAMDEGQLYLARDGVASPLRLSRFVHLSSAPAEAKFTTYFYSRREADGVRLVSYQHGPDAETTEALDSFSSEFGSLLDESRD